MTMMKRLNRSEDGFAMVIAVVLLSLVASLGAVVMASGNHTATVTGRGRSRIQSLHVAEAGVQDSLIRLQKSNGAFSGTFTGATNEGTFTTTVTALGRSRYRVASTGIVGTAASLRASRDIQVTLAPPESFEAALFSYTSVDTKNNDHIVGDVWANQNVIVDENDLIEGGVTAATGYVHMRLGSRVTKTVQAGGYDSTSTNAIFLANNARVDGNAVGSVTAPTDPVTCGGESTNNFTIKLSSGSVVGGNTRTWGSKQGAGTVTGTVSNNVCIAAPAARSLPVFSYNAANYPAATLHEWGTPSAASATAVTDFNTWFTANKASLKGTLVVFQSGSVGQSLRLDLTGGKIAGDLTIVTNLPIFANGMTEQVDGAGLPVSPDSILVLASFYKPPTGTICDVNQDSSECSVHLKNNFSTTGATATLVYAPYGPVAVKNNSNSFGAIYADNIQIKNNQDLTYDSRIERLVGFGPVTLEQAEWKEL